MREGGLKMAAASNSLSVRIIPLLIAVCLIGMPAHAKYGGGSGTAEDPYQIATAADLMALGDSPQDHNKHFILTADIDLDPNLPGRKVFDKAVIAPNWETPFTGVFDGNGHTILNLTITIKGGISYVYGGLFGSVSGSSAQVKNLRLLKPDVKCNSAAGSASLLVVTLDDGNISNCHVQDCNLSSWSVWATGGLVQGNGGTITDCHISGKISGARHIVGALAAGNGENGTITRCSFSGTVRGASGGDAATGGLVGSNAGGIAFSYSTGSVSGP
jgi:hypothetical protein